jgi:hypothetical protein
VLSILAKDILTVHVSTTSSEFAFSLCGKVLDEHRRRLSLEHVEMVSLIKDWEQGDAQQQHNMENKELEEKMVNLYLNRYGPDGHGHRDAGATPVGDGNGSDSGSET